MRDAAIDTHRQSGHGAARPRASGAPPLDGMLGEGLASRDPSPTPRKGEGITSAAIAAQRLGGARGGGAAPGRGRSSPGPLVRLRARLPRVRPLKAVTIAAFSVALVGIVANAMVFQRGRHPAPLFGLGQSVDGQPDAAQRTASALPAPPAPAPLEHTGTIPAPTPVAEPVPTPVAVAPKPVPARHAATKPRHEDLAAAKPRASGGTNAGAEAHPRPGHAATKPAVKPDTKPAVKPDTKVEAKADPVGKLLAEPAHKAKPVARAADVKPAVEKADGDHQAKADAALSAHPHRRVAATELPADAVKKAAKPE